MSLTLNAEIKEAETMTQVIPEPWEDFAKDNMSSREYLLSSTPVTAANKSREEALAEYLLLFSHDLVPVEGQLASIPLLGTEHQAMVHGVIRASLNFHCHFATHI
ncbi:predicted protein [Histoplasma capsulatum var. duboisii H88]|nr:predicted protein [Histoplasma capsulatum var. duboisii H88]